MDYVVAAYGLALLLVGGYVVSVVWRAREARREARALEGLAAAQDQSWPGGADPNDQLAREEADAGQDSAAGRVPGGGTPS